MPLSRLVSASSASLHASVLWQGQLPQDEDQEGPQNKGASTTIDSYFEAAYHSSGQMRSFSSLPYWWLVANLGMGCSVGAVQMWFVSFALSDECFLEEMLGGDLSFMGGLLGASLFGGMLVGGVGAGVYADAVGRRPVLLVGLAFAFAMDIVTAFFCRDGRTGELIVAQFAAGVGVGASIPSVFTLATELSPPSQRGRFVTIVATCWVLGAIYTTSSAMILLGRDGLSWRYFAAACSLSSFLTWILNYWYVPESPRFLALRGEYRKAAQIANDITQRMGTKDLPLTEEDVRAMFIATSAIVAESSNDNEPDKEGTPLMPRAASGPSAETMAAPFHPMSDIVALYSSEMAHITIPLSVLWFTLCFGCYGLLTWISTIFEEIQLTNIYFSTFLFAAAELPGDILSTIVIDRVGRIRLLFWAMLLSAVSLFFFGMFAALGASEYPVGVVLSACAFQTFSTGLGWNALDTLTGEIFPTPVRSTAVGVCNAYGRIGPVIAQVVNGALVRRPVVLLGVSCSMLLLATAMTLVLRDEDMAGKPLSEGIAYKDNSTSDKTSKATSRTSSSSTRSRPQ